MSFLFPITPNSAAKHLPYVQASVIQREQLLAFVRQRLRYHFPTLSPAAWLRALFEFQPTLVLSGPDTVTLEVIELRQLVQHVASSPELPLLDPPIYGLPALELAQRWLRAQELLAVALSELETRHQGPRLKALLAYLGQPYPLAEQVIQAWRWDLPSSPPLPAGLPRE
ncbi:MAG: hypothetical protein EOO56_19705 [Hymenobacter sp.]|nr:MAG: hypothetical protein EOO56_19705 [Hymenobacter sp.]